MSWGHQLVIACPIAVAAGSFTVDITRSWARARLAVPTMPSASAIDVYGSYDGTTYLQMRHNPNPLTATVLAPSFIVSAGAGANGALVPIPSDVRYLKFICTDSAPTTAVGFKVICSDM